MDGERFQDLIVGAAFENSAGPITGKAANFTVTVTNAATGAALASGAPIENPASSGIYEFTVNSTLLTARMRIKAIWSNTTDELRAEKYYAVGDIPSWARTRREIRKRIAGRLFPGRQVWQLLAGSSGLNSTTRAYLPDLVTGGTDEYRGGWLWFGSGGNAGKERQATASDEAALTVTWAPALGVATAANDRVELYPVRPSQINDAIDDAVADLADLAFEFVDEGVLDTDGVTSEWSLPTDARWVSKVGLTRDSDGRFLGWYAPSSWSLLPGQRLRLDDQSGETGQDPLDWGAWAARLGPPDGYKLRVQMLCEVGPPLYDDSFVVVAPEEVVAQAAYRLLLTMPERRDQWPFWERDAERARLRATTAFPAGSRAVRR